VGGNWALAFGVEQPFLGQASFEFVEGAAQCAFAGFLHVFGDELVVAACLVQADARTDQHLQAGFGGEAEMPVAVAEHRRADLGVRILEREVEVSGGGGGDIR